MIPLSGLLCDFSPAVPVPKSNSGESRVLRTSLTTGVLDHGMQKCRAVGSEGLDSTFPPTNFNRVLYFYVPADMFHISHTLGLLWGWGWA